MASSSYPGPVSAIQVGSYFVGQYYQVLKEHPDLAYQFYTESSSMIRIEGEESVSASSMLILRVLEAVPCIFDLKRSSPRAKTPRPNKIHGLLMSLNLTTIEVKTINSLESWNGGILVVVSGLVKTKEFNGKRKFVQTFFLAPQDKGYFVLNDIFQFSDDGNIYQHPPTIVTDDKARMQFSTSSPTPEPAVSNYALDEEAREYMNAVNIEDNSGDEYGQDNLDDETQENPVDEYNLPEEHHYEEVEAEGVLENSYAEDLPVSVQTLHTVPVAQDSIDEPIEEPTKKTYASILRAKGQFVSAVSSQPSFPKAAPTASDWSYTPPPAVAQTNVASNLELESVVETADDSFIEDEGLSKSVYVRNLPSTVTEGEIADVFKSFGKIIPDGVAIKLRKEIGICYAFVEFEDLLGVHNAIKASPVQLAGRPVYIEERRANAAGGSRGGRRGRGRGGYTAESARGRYGSQSSGRGSNFNGSYVRGSR